MKISDDPSVEKRGREEVEGKDGWKDSPRVAVKLPVWPIQRLREVWRFASLLGLQARSSLGLSPKLPPGSLSPFPMGRFRDDRFYLRKLKRYGPIFKVLWCRNLAVCIVGHQQGRRLLAEFGSSLVPITIEIDGFVPKGFMRCMRPDDHPHYRRLFIDALRVELITEYEPVLRQIIRDELNEMTVAGTPRIPPAEHLLKTLDRIATRLLLVLFFGVRPDQAIFATLEAAYHRLGPKGLVHVIGPDQRASYLAIRSVVVQLVDSIKGGDAIECGDSVLRRVVVDGGVLAIDETALGNCRSTWSRWGATTCAGCCGGSSSISVTVPPPLKKSAQFTRAIAPLSGWLRPACSRH